MHTAQGQAGGHPQVSVQAQEGDALDRRSRQRLIEPSLRDKAQMGAWCHSQERLLGEVSHSTATRVLRINPQTSICSKCSPASTPMFAVLYTWRICSRPACRCPSSLNLCRLALNLSREVEYRPWALQGKEARYLAGMQAALLHSPKGWLAPTPWNPLTQADNPIPTATTHPVLPLPPVSCATGAGKPWKLSAAQRRRVLPWLGELLQPGACRSSTLPSTTQLPP